jgi:predicted DNA-binding transcriptional regulator YafY
MRADRLVAALLLMQVRGRVTAAELASELEVSVGTARRDLEALSAAGIPVYPQPGRGGGWSLVGGGSTDLSGLSAAEAQALFLLAGPAAAVSGEAKAALRKLVRALPQTFRADAEAAARATMIDPTRWGEPTGQPAERPDGFTLATVWQQVVGEVERRRSRTWATVLIDARLVPVLRTQFGRHCHTDGEPARGRARVRLAAPTPLDIARHLAGWGAMIEVVEPRSVQAELARIGTELTERYTSVN